MTNCNVKQKPFCFLIEFRSSFSFSSDLFSVCRVLLRSNLSMSIDFFSFQSRSFFFLYVSFSSVRFSSIIIGKSIEIRRFFLSIRSFFFRLGNENIGFRNNASNRTLTYDENLRNRNRNQTSTNDESGKKRFGNIFFLSSFYSCRQINGAVLRTKVRSISSYCCSSVVCRNRKSIRRKDI